MERSHSRFGGDRRENGQPLSFVIFSSSEVNIAGDLFESAFASVPGCVVMESGIGSGSLVMSFGRAVAPMEYVYTFDFHEQREASARVSWWQYVRIRFTREPEEQMQRKFTRKIGKFNCSSTPNTEDEDQSHLQSHEAKTGQILQHENSATCILCQLKPSHDTRASHLTFRKNVVGVVAMTLGKVDDYNL